MGYTEIKTKHSTVLLYNRKSGVISIFYINPFLIKVLGTYLKIMLPGKWLRGLEAKFSFQTPVHN